MPVADLCHKHGLSSPTLYKWKAKFGGMDVSEARRLKALEDENTDEPMASGRDGGLDPRPTDVPVARRRR